MAKPYSLANRLQWVVGVVLVASLGLTGLVLDQLFVRNTSTNAAEKLELHVYSLLATTEVDNGGLTLPARLEIPRLNQLDSGLYAVVRDQLGTVLWQSPSAVSVQYALQTAPLPIPRRGDKIFMRLDQGFEEPMFVINYGVAWEVNGEYVDYILTVMESMLSYQRDITRYRQYLWGWLAAVAVLLLGLQHLILRGVLRPLKSVIADLYAIQDGQQDVLSGDYPREVSPLSTTLNELLESEKSQRERYRHNLADLAHSLKTPLAVLRGIATDPTDTAVREVLPQQVDRLDQMITYQLQRAVISGRKSLSKPVPVPPVIHKLRQTLDKVYAAKGVSVEIVVDEGEQFFGDQHDLYEVLGNLTENAYKYTNSWVRVVCCTSKEQKIKRQFGFVVEDDGPGVPLERRESILARGVRLDSQEKGQGIGLAVVADIIDGYNGDIHVESSEREGARFVVAF